MKQPHLHTARRTTLLIVLLGSLTACNPVRFPTAPAPLANNTTAEPNARPTIAIDIDQNGSIDCRWRLGQTGRIEQLLLPAASTHSPPDKPTAPSPTTATQTTIHLDTIPTTEVPHLIVALDGVPYELVDTLYQQGRFRLFHPPSRLISCFPAMTDLAFHKLFGGQQPLAWQTEYYDPNACTKTDGNSVYLSGNNADWANQLAYRAPFSLDALMYISPKMVFHKELEGFLHTARNAQPGQPTILYSVATAGLGTRGSRQAMIDYLDTIDRFCQQMVYERQGRIKITLLADHGQNMTGIGRVRFQPLLKQHGFRPTHCLKQPNDVVIVDYGLVTYADFMTDTPEQLAAVLLEDPSVNLLCYPNPAAEPRQLIVENHRGRAIIDHRNSNITDQYRYTPLTGDPLELTPIIDQLTHTGQATSDGFIDDRTLFRATATHTYPDPLKRLWHGFFVICRYPPDLVATLKDGYYHGDAFFDAMIGKANSTHGSLNRVNSTTAVMTMTEPLPPVLRLEEVMPLLRSEHRPAPRTTDDQPQ